MEEAELILLEGALEHHFADRQRLVNALTHSSAIEEGKGRQSNERLEFLGDSVLNLSITSYLFERFPELPEGGLTRIRAGVVSEVSLAEAARKLRLGRYLILGRAMEASDGRCQASVLADAFESVIAALYLDGGLEVACGFVLRHLGEHITRAVEGQSYRDYKTELQEWAQRDGDVHIHYEVERTEGPDHQKVFFICVLIEGEPQGHGSGRSKKEAEQAAARQACERLRAKGEK